MKKWHLLIDVEKCEDCNNCLMACKDEHLGNDWPGYSLAQPRLGQRWIDILRRERGRYPLIDVAYRPTVCMHCGNAPCIKASGGSITKRSDGIVLIDPDRVKGQKELVKACPYEMIWWNEELQVPQKCTLCAHLLDQGWKQPRCVQACPTGALRAVYLEDAQMNSIREAESLEVLYPELGTEPSVYYKNLYRIEKCFIAGSVAVQQDGIVDCARGAAVRLYRGADGEGADQADGADSAGGKDMLAEEITDAFGDFKLDRLEPNSGSYRLEIEMKGYATKVVPVELQTSISLGTILLGFS